MKPASLSKHATAFQSCAVQKNRTHFDRKTPANFRKTPANFRKTPAKTRKLPQIRKSRSFDDQGIGVHWHVGKCCEVYLLCMANARLETTQFVCVFAQIVAKPLEFGKS